MIDQLSSAVQLSLDVNLRDDATFENFYLNDGDALPPNGLVVDALKKLSRGVETMAHLIWGGQGSGLTHLMQAVCHEARANQRSVRYFPAAEIVGKSTADIFEGIEETCVVCIDGVDLMTGLEHWEIALFHLFNKLRDRGHTLLLASHVSPASLAIDLADLKSRVLGCVIFQVVGLDDEQKQAALQMRAEARGMNMPEDVAKYILSHCSRNMSDLFYLLNRLDNTSIQQHRKLTIPFVKEILASGAP